MKNEHFAIDGAVAGSFFPDPVDVFYEPERRRDLVTKLKNLP